MLGSVAVAKHRDVQFRVAVLLPHFRKAPDSAPQGIQIPFPCVTFVVCIARIRKVKYSESLRDVLYPL